jgi:hypothetical protein
LQSSTRNTTRARPTEAAPHNEGRYPQTDGPTQAKSSQEKRSRSRLSGIYDADADADLVPGDYGNIPQYFDGIISFATTPTAATELQRPCDSWIKPLNEESYSKSMQPIAKMEKTTVCSKSDLAALFVYGPGKPALSAVASTA